MTDYIKTKKRLEILESEFTVLRHFVKTRRYILITKKNTNIEEIRVEEVHDHEEGKHFLEFIFIMKMAK